jgi:hypothetical protein
VPRSLALEGTASLEVSLLWVGHANQDEQCFLDDLPEVNSLIITVFNEEE